MGVTHRTGASALATAAITGVIAFVLFVAGGGVLWTATNRLLGWSLLAFGLASVIATAMLMLAGTRPGVPSQKLASPPTSGSRH